MQFLRASRGRAHPHTAPAEAPRRGEAFGVRQPSSPLALWLRREERKDGLLCVDRKAAEGCRTPRRCRVVGHGTTWHFRRGHFQDAPPPKSFLLVNVVSKCPRTTTRMVFSSSWMALMLPAALPASSCAHPFIAQMASSPGGAALIVSKRVFILENKAVESERSCCVVHSLLLPRQA